MTFLALFIPVYARRWNPIHTIANALLRTLDMRTATARVIAQFAGATLAVAGVKLAFGKPVFGATAFDGSDATTNAGVLLVGQLLITTALVVATRENDRGDFLLAAFFASWVYAWFPIANPATTVAMAMNSARNAGWLLIGQALGIAVGPALRALSIQHYSRYATAPVADQGNVGRL